MNKIFKIVVLVINTNLILVNINAQNSLLEKIKLSDSVVVVSYKAPSPIKFKKNKDLASDEIIVNGKLNTLIIKERRLLTLLQKNSLIKILNKPFSDSIIEKGMCFLPRHSILIFIKGKISYIHICFQCQEIETSTDIKVRQNDFDQLTWKRLKIFMRSSGLKYGYNNSASK